MDKAKHTEAENLDQQETLNEPLEQTPIEVLNDDGGLPQPSQDPNEVIQSDEGAEG